MQPDVTATPPLRPSLFPSVRSGRGLDQARAVPAWSTAAWLLAVEGRAFIEDLEGGVDQPQLRQIVRIKLLELLVDVDTLLAGWAAIGEGHRLAIALEYGLKDVAEIDGPSLIQMFAVADEHGSDDEVRALWDRLCAEFPGELPNPLLASGQREIMRALRNWSKLCTAVGIDAGFLEPFLKDA